MPAGSAAWTAASLRSLTPLANGFTIRTLTRASSLPGRHVLPSSTSTVSEPGVSSVRPPSRTIATAEPASRSHSSPPAPTTRTLEVGIEVGHQRRMADLGEGLTGAHPEIGRDDEREPARKRLAQLRQRARLGAQRLHADEHAVACRASHRRQAGDIADALVVELAHGLPLARLGPEAHLAKRMAPPVLEPVTPALVVAEAVGATPGGECRGAASSANGRVVRCRTTRYMTSASSSAVSGSTRAAYGILPPNGGEIPRRAGRPGRA